MPGSLALSLSLEGAEEAPELKRRRPGQSGLDHHHPPWLEREPLGRMEVVMEASPLSVLPGCIIQCTPTPATCVALRWIHPTHPWHPSLSLHRRRQQQLQRRQPIFIFFYSLISYRLPARNEKSAMPMTAPQTTTSQSVKEALLLPCLEGVRLSTTNFQ